MEGINNLEKKYRNKYGDKIKE